VFEPGAAPRAVCTAFGSADPAKRERAYFGARSGWPTRRPLRQAKPVAAPPRPAACPTSQADLDDEAYGAVVARMKEHIARARSIRSCRRAPSDALRRSDGRLRRAAPARPQPLSFLRVGARSCLFGASPETSVRLFRETNVAKVEVKPIAGTRPRGATGDEDDGSRRRCGSMRRSWPTHDAGRSGAQRRRRVSAVGHGGSRNC
jgi:anthranilate synthase component 1